MRGTSELGSISTLYCTRTCLVRTRTIDIVFRFNHSASLREQVEIIVGGIITRCDVCPVMIATQLLHWFHTSRPFVHNLHEVEVTVSNDGQSHLHPIAHFEWGVGCWVLGVGYDLSDDLDTTAAVLNLTRLLVELCIDRTP